MKCVKCGHEEAVPEWILQELNEFDNDDAARPAVLAIGIPEAAIVAPR